MRKVKILATLGPASDSQEMITELLKEGVNAFRLNFSHGTHDGHKKTYDRIRAAASRLQCPAAVVADLQGPKIRLGDLPEPVMLKRDDIISIAYEKKATGEILPCTYKGIAKDTDKGDTVLINDGLVELEVTRNDKTAITCKVIQGGIISSHKGINLPGVAVSSPSVTPKDIKDLEFALDLGVDYIAVSFVRTGKGLKKVRKIITDKDKDTHIIAKIEKPEALENIDSIMKISDGIMVARGDLAVETSTEDVPILQKNLVNMCNAAGNLDIVATQMLDSMVNNITPTRAEATDVANAVFDGADVVMLSQETAVGKNVIQTVRTMDKIVRKAEESTYFRKHFYMPNDRDLTELNGITHAACLAADEVKAKALVVLSLEGSATAMISNKRPEVPIISITPDRRLYNLFSLYYGVTPVMCPPAAGLENSLTEMKKTIRSGNLIPEGETAVFLANTKNGTHVLTIDSV